IGDAAVRQHQLPRRARFPVGLCRHAEPVLLHELRRGQRLPQLLARGADVGDVDKSAAAHVWFLSGWCCTRRRGVKKKNRPRPRFSGGEGWGEGVSEVTERKSEIRSG